MNSSFLFSRKCVMINFLKYSRETSTGEHLYGKKIYINNATILFFNLFTNCQDCKIIHHTFKYLFFEILHLSLVEYKLTL